MLNGRAFDTHDVVGAPRVAIISHALAEKMWPGQAPNNRWLLIGIAIATSATNLLTASLYHVAPT
jgi:hypothetical protein